MKVIGLTGLPRSGKDTAALYLEKKYGFKHFDFYQDSLVPELKKRGLKASKENATKLGLELREEMGMGAPAKILMEKMERPEKAVFTGFRSVEEVNEVKKASDSFILVEIKASKQLRFERRSKGEGKTLEEFLHREKVEAEKMGVLKVLMMSEAVIDNSGSKEELEQNLDAFMESLGKA
jgi:dephospho-CoA kinase